MFFFGRFKVFWGRGPQIRVDLAEICQEQISKPDFGPFLPFPNPNHFPQNPCKQTLVYLPGTLVPGYQDPHLRIKDLKQKRKNTST